jgi:hypothetical protein
MVFDCTGIYFLGFVVLRRRLTGQGGGKADEGGGLGIEAGRSSVRTACGLAGQWLVEPTFWLTGLVILAVVAYALDYPAAVKSTSALTLVGAAMLGQAAAVWGGSPKSKVQSPKPIKCGVPNAEWGIADCRGKKGECRSVGDEIVLVLIILLAVAAVWQGETGRLFQYRGQGRWSGPWDNPNTFGMLMGVGLLLAVGRLVQSRMNADCGVRSAEFSKRSAGGDLNLEPRTLNFEPRTARWGQGFGGGGW